MTLSIDFTPADGDVNIIEAPEDVPGPDDSEYRTGPMDPERKAEWVADLRSGVYPQGKHTLRSVDDKFCCLGVACDRAVKNNIIPEPTLTSDREEWVYHDYETAQLPEVVRDWLGLGLGDCDPHITIGDRSAPLSHWNDNGKTFAEIADAIEAQL